MILVLETIGHYLPNIGPESVSADDSALLGWSDKQQGLSPLSLSPPNPNLLPHYKFTQTTNNQGFLLTRSCNNLPTGESLSFERFFLTSDSK
jgi:hypothetical protein